MPLTLPSNARATSTAPIERISWEDMQIRRAQGLCFNCNEKFKAGHRCQTPRLILLEGQTGIDNDIYKQATDEILIEDD